MQTISKKSNVQTQTPWRTREVAWLLIVISILLMGIDNFFKMQMLVGGWHIVMYLLLLMPLLYLIATSRVQNPYTKWVVPLLVLMVGDMFYYSNDFVQFMLPVVFYVITALLYLTSMHKVTFFHQTFVPKFSRKIALLDDLKSFLEGLVVYRGDKMLYRRILLGIGVTLPFLVLFGALLMGADSHYSQLVKSLFRFDAGFSPSYLVTVPLYFLGYLLFFLYTFSNAAVRHYEAQEKRLDVVIVGIFLGMINLLFLSFVVMQIPFLMQSDYLPCGVNIAAFAREGFFQLMAVMGLVSVILLVIFRRYRKEKILQWLLIALLVQTIVIGVVSLKKMHLYQSLLGATVLRYYVEWFDYFLIVVLVLGIFFLLRGYRFARLLDLVFALGLAYLTLVASVDIDAMVARHNIKKFHNTPQKLDRSALKRLSIDALPVVKQYQIDLEEVKCFDGKEIRLLPWYIQIQRNGCNTFATYHYGYCTKLQKYGE